MGTATILVVEDNRLNMKLVRDVLEFAGYDVVEAGTGEEGVELAISLRPDLVLMDLQLPGIDGTQALRRIQGVRGRRHDAGGRRHRLRHGQRPGSRRSRPGSTASWRSPSMPGPCRRRWRPS